MYYIYVLQSLRDRQLYLGVTNDLRRRLLEHNTGQSRSTAQRRPFRLVYYEAYASWKDARLRERNLKKHKQGKTWLKRRIHFSLTA